MEKVLILANNVAGLLHFRKETVSALVEAGYDVTVAVPEEDGTCHIEALGAKVLFVSVDRRGTNPLSDLKLFFNYRRLIRTLKPAVVLTYTVKCNIYGGLACRTTRTPYLSTVTGLGSALSGNGLLSKFTCFLYRLGVARCTTLFYQNASIAAFFQERRLYAGKSVVLPGSGVNLEHHTAAEYPSEKEGIRLCFLGRLMKEKGISELLDAAQALSETHPEVHFHLAGMCEEDEWLTRVQELSAQGVLVYHGALEDVRELIAASHAAVMPSYHEGMCNALMESAAMARPLLASDVVGCRELVEEQNGILFAVQSADALKDAVERFLALTTEQRRNMGLCGREKMKREFDRRLVTERVTQAVADAINMNTRR